MPMLVPGIFIKLSKIFSLGKFQIDSFVLCGTDPALINIQQLNVNNQYQMR